MKIEQLLVQHLYNTKKVSLQGIGTLSLDPSVALPSEGDKDFVMPANAIAFHYDLKTGEDSDLVNFIVEKTRKIKPLAMSDLESYSMLAKQFLNIGKPFVIDGVGTLQKNQAGSYEFIPGNFITPKIDDTPRQLKSKPEEIVSFESEPKINNNRRNLLIAAVLLAVIFAGLGIYHFFFNNQPSMQEEPTAIQTEILPDTTAIIDTTKKITIDSSQIIAQAPVKTDSNNFRIVIKEYTSLEAATKAMDKLTSYGHKLEIITVDSARYRLAMPFTKDLSDTLRTKDSLKKFFGGNPYVLIR